MINQDDIIKSNKGLVISIAKRYQDKGLDFDDLIQEGYIGLLTAYKHYDDMKGIKFSTYATYWIRQAIVRAIELTGSLIRTPSYCNQLKTPNYQSIDNNQVDNGKGLDYSVLLSEIANILQNKDDFELYIDHFANDVSYRDLAKKYKVSHEAIHKRLIKLHQIVLSKVNK